MRSILGVLITAMVWQGLLYSQKKITILTVAHSIDYMSHNLASCLQQQYDNFRIIYVADGLRLCELAVLQEWLCTHDTHKKITLIVNNQKKGLLYSYWHVIHTMVADDEIVIPLNAHGWIDNPFVLSSIAKMYKNPDVWMTYSKYRVFPTMKEYEAPLPSHDVILSNTWREGKISKYYAQFSTFYAGLFKQIALEDLIYRNGFFKYAVELAYIYPLLEMAHSHVRSIDQVHYISNDLVDESVLYAWLIEARLIKKKKQYFPLSSLQCEDNNDIGNGASADILVFSFNRPLQLYALLESMERYLQHVGRISVLYRVSSPAFESGYDAVRKQFPSVTFIKQNIKPTNTFKPLLMEWLRQASPYILFAVDDIVVKDHVDLSECITWLNRTHAYGFFLRLGKNITACYFPQAPINPDTSVRPYMELSNSLCAWQFIHGSHDWKYPNTLDMTIYRKNEIVPVIAPLLFEGPNMLEGLWYGTTDFKGIGLCFSVSKIVNLPLNVVQDDMFDNPHRIDIAPEKLLQFFLGGLKISIEAVHNLEHISAHTDYVPPFVMR